MSIQKYVLPEWRKTVKEAQIPFNLQSKYERTGYSMAEYLDRQMMRKLPGDWFHGWLRYHFPKRINEEIIKLHKVIAKNFAEFIIHYRAGTSHEFNISTQDISNIISIQNNLNKKRDEIDIKFSSLKSEISLLRNELNQNKPKREKKRIIKTKKKVKEITSQQKPILSDKVNHDAIYEKWMVEVGKKTISKSYKAIHDYMSKYIMEFAEQKSKDGKVTLEIVEAFLKEFGKDKRPKTMNHYNRVALKYFWPFYANIVYGSNNK